MRLGGGEVGGGGKGGGLTAAEQWTTDQHIERSILHLGQGSYFFSYYRPGAFICTGCVCVCEGGWGLERVQEGGREGEMWQP